MSRRFTVAVIGAGDMGSEHVRAWMLAGHAVLAVADIDSARARALADRHGVPHVYVDYREAIAHPAVEIVSICTPLAYHAPITIHAAALGKHIFCEKPLARSLAEAAAMETAVVQAGVQFGLGFQRSLAEGVVLLRQWAQEGRFGRPLVFSSDLLQEVRPKRSMHDRHGNNGPLMDVCCHYYLLWQEVFQSRPASVYAQGRVLAQGRPELAHLRELAIDTGIITVTYASGDLATMTVSWGLAAHTRQHGRPDRVFGPRGGAEGDVQRRLELYEDDRVEMIEIEPQNLHQREFAQFIDALEHRQPAPVGFRQGKEMLALTMAIFQSIKTRQAVPVSYDVGFTSQPTTAERA